ncbi:amidase [Nonomuraea gerenzanensis]|uniref:Aspartyl-tRNA(Asn) amidotransferase subunit A @ Glutamyl-tRNA(Gln) amidotransferase subunit A n=1 Tax=Nonomuraea gerenzanensis TaxID=93944 RepID=A0A1M4E8P3_9ACTN|nr:amidase [Nonomuraea gerenzanensis]UBU17495.1 amidase [Nonomuraea gerenzanensis]SBO95251.1 Aspartyl-tRNA(Asn) amidotransferase subunit A @ Glutamyl-tRNA(Gln) amidotransferase subunit A [Nonomuraea gerenzanensis]
MTFPLTLSDAATALRGGEVTSVALTEEALARADRLDGELGTYLARFDDSALRAAKQADQELAAGVDRGPLHGIPFGVKDIIAAAEGPTTAQSLVLDPAWGAGRDAPVVARLRAAGAVITGKVTTMEFACGMVDPSKPFPVPRNPWEPGTWPGGSSSGTGNGVAAGMFLAGLGTDTAGSIRIPAAFCGVSGLMPTFGRVPKSGVAPLGYSLDHVGPLARSARDCAAVLEVIAGYHPSDPDCVDLPLDLAWQSGSSEGLPGGWGSGSLEGLRVGVVREHHFPGDADPAVAPAFEAALATLTGLGATLTEVRLPYWHEMLTANLVTACAEALAYHRNDAATRWADYFAATRAMLARGALISGADYVQAQRVRRVAQDAVARLFDGVDVIVTPTASMGAPTYDSLTDAEGRIDVEAMFAQVFTQYWDCVGNPVLVVPMGFTEAGLPLSLQLAGRPFEEATILRAGDAYQRLTDWHLRVPALAA